MKTKKIIVLEVLMLCLAMAVSAKTKIVATIFPEYDWVRQIAGEKNSNVDVKLLLDNGVDLHNFQPSVKDIATVGNADIFIYVGGESDEWVKGVLKNAKNKKLVAINLLEVLGDRVHEEETVEGMEHEHHHDDEAEEEEHEHHHGEAEHDEHEHHHHEEAEHHHHHDDDDEDEIEYDEHVWLSLKNAKILCKAIADALCSKDSANAETYRKNLAEYSAKLDRLDNSYAECVKNSKRNTVLFGDRFPFRYLTDDYGIKYYAAFTGCSAETEASFKTVIFLSNKVDELNLPCILQIESGNGKLPATIIKNSKSGNISVLTMDSMQATTSLDVKKGANYLGIMTQNLEVLKKALN